jgi:hypothetical protein
MRLWLCLPVGVLVVAGMAAAMAAAQSAPSLPPMPTAPTSGDAVLAARCKAMSFARRPAGQMASTMRNMQIARCVKNKGLLTD